jgi:hypothetical protein
VMLDEDMVVGRALFADKIIGFRIWLLVS